MGNYGGDDKPNNIPSGDQNNIPNGNSSHEQPDMRDYITKADIEQAARQVYEKCKRRGVTWEDLITMRLATSRSDCTSAHI